MFNVFLKYIPFIRACVCIMLFYELLCFNKNHKTNTIYSTYYYLLLFNSVIIFFNIYTD